MGLYLIFIGIGVCWTCGASDSVFVGIDAVCCFKGDGNSSCGCVSAMYVGLFHVSIASFIRSLQ